ncbi:MAG: DUF3782 domain-containing protein, partial [Symploca sp. SIO2E6]|nr:DUF3782 domain-containing protein [Symploca sp. SIO2E6]
QQDRDLRDFVLRTVENYYAGKQETESRFDQILAELRRDREEQSRKWEEQSRKWEENHKQIQQLLLENKQLNSKHDSTIGALGARWGLYSESSFRNALKGILEDSFAVEVLHLTEYDSAGEVFGRPEQVELDLLIKNGLLIICEIKSSMSKSDIYTFERKVRFYQNRHQQTANRKIVISPMVHPRAKEIASELEVEVYSYAEDLGI